MPTSVPTSPWVPGGTPYTHHAHGAGCGVKRCSAAPYWLTHRTKSCLNDRSHPEFKCTQRHISGQRTIHLVGISCDGFVQRANMALKSVSLTPEVSLAPSYSLVFLLHRTTWGWVGQAAAHIGNLSAASTWENGYSYTISLTLAMQDAQLFFSFPSTSSLTQIRCRSH